MENEYVIWWLADREFRDMPKGVINDLSPRIDLNARFAQNGQYRLVSMHPIPCIPCIVGADDNPVWRLILAANLSGTVIKASDMHLLPRNIGVITDPNCMLVPTCPTCGRIAIKDGDGTHDGVEVLKCGTCRVECDHDSDCKQPFLFTICNKEGRPGRHIAVCSPHNHS